VTSKSLFLSTLVIVLMAGIYFYAANSNQPEVATFQKTNMRDQDTRMPFVTIGRPISSESSLALEDQTASDGLPMIRPLPPQKMTGREANSKDSK
jgi:hypothetical protein